MNIELYVKGGQADKIVFLIICCFILGFFIVSEIKAWWENRKNE